MPIKLGVLTTVTCFELALVVSAIATEPIVTNKPAFRLFAPPSASDLKRTNQFALATAKTSNQPPVLLRLTNSVENLSAAFTETPLSEDELHAKRFERMNERPILQSSREVPKRFLGRIPFSGGALLSRNPNARRNPLEVDGW